MSYLCWKEHKKNIKVYLCFFPIFVRIFYYLHVLVMFFFWNICYKVRKERFAIKTGHIFLILSKFYQNNPIPRDFFFSFLCENFFNVSFKKLLLPKYNSLKEFFSNKKAFQTPKIFHFYFWVFKFCCIVFSR